MLKNVNFFLVHIKPKIKELFRSLHGHPFKNTVVTNDLKEMGANNRKIVEKDHV